MAMILQPFKIDLRMRDQLDILAERKNISRAAIIRQYIQIGLDNEASAQTKNHTAKAAA